jgi:hypothetical protein
MAASFKYCDEPACSGTTELEDSNTKPENI